jgi:isocitrate dehydrogenase
MAKFKFLQISQDRYDHWIASHHLYGYGESWQEALRNALKLETDTSLDETNNIFRFEDGNFESCQDEVWAEQKRRREIEAEKLKAQLLADQEQKQEQEKALYLELKKKYG